VARRSFGPGPNWRPFGAGEKPVVRIRQRLESTKLGSLRVCSPRAKPSMERPRSVAWRGSPWAAACWNFGPSAVPAHWRPCPIRGLDAQLLASTAAPRRQRKFRRLEGPALAPMPAIRPRPASGKIPTPRTARAGQRRRGAAVVNLLSVMNPPDGPGCDRRPDRTGFAIFRPCLRQPGWIVCWPA